MELTLSEQSQTHKSHSSIAVRPFTENTSDNMGLSRYEMVLFEGIFHEEPLICLESNGIRRYKTGLNEFAPELKSLPEEERLAKIKDIRETVAQLERELVANVIDPEDPDFWKKVILLQPNNDDFWSKIIMRMSNDPVYLTPNTDPYDLIKIRAIEAEGFSMIAPSIESAKTSPFAPKFYLDKFEKSISSRTEVKKLRNKALSELQKLFDKNPSKLFLVSKVVDPNSIQYRKSTAPDLLYDNMDNYINGNTVDRDKRKTAERFLEISGLDMETLKMRAIVKDANFYKLISTKSDGHIYHVRSQTLMGRNPTEVVLFLKNPLHEDIMTDVMRGVEHYWNT